MFLANRTFCRKCTVGFYTFVQIFQGMNKKTLVIGASTKPDRYSNMAIRRLIQHQIPVLAVGLREGEVEGVKIVKEHVQIPGIHTVTVYVGPSNQPACYDYILSLNPLRVIFNPGTENPAFETILSERGIEVVRGCTLVMLSSDQY